MPGSVCSSETELLTPSHTSNFQQGIADASLLQCDHGAAGGTSVPDRSRDANIRPQMCFCNVKKKIKNQCSLAVKPTFK